LTTAEKLIEMLTIQYAGISLAAKEHQQQLLLHPYGLATSVRTLGGC
jgi:hypothetical protein